MNKTLIPVGIAAVVVAVSIAYGAVVNPGGEPEEEEPSSEVGISVSLDKNFIISVHMVLMEFL